MTEFQPVFQRLKDIIQPFAPGLKVTADSASDYVLNTPYSPAYKKELFFGGVQIKKNYVSYHLMPVYMFPGLLDGISERLKKRMQGKSCFNFKTLDEELVAELEGLTRKGYERLQQEGLLE